MNRNSLSAHEASKLLEKIERAEADAYAAESAKECRQDERGNYERGYILGVTEIACTIAARLGLATGARRGEVLALTWQSVDFSETPEKQIHRLRRGGELGF